jgi:ABC-type transport system substrate-binding protein
VNGMDFAAMWGPIYLAKKHEAVAIHVIYGIYTDPEYPLGGYFHSRLNRNSYKNPKVDSLIEQATAVLDQTDRKRLYADFVEQIVQDAPHFWVGSPDELWVHSAKVRLPDKKLGFLMITNLEDWERLQ